MSQIIDMSDYFELLQCVEAETQAMLAQLELEPDEIRDFGEMLVKMARDRAMKRIKVFHNDH